MKRVIKIRLKKWIDAGIIDDGTAQRIEKYESEGNHNHVITAILGVGGLAIVVGVISVIAANWYRIPGHVKICCNFLWLLLLGTSIVVSDRKKWRLMREVLIFIFFGAILSSIALVGQVYHLQSHLFKPLLAWICMGTPIVFFSREKYIPYFWTLGVAALYFSFLAYMHEKNILEYSFQYVGLFPIILFYFSEIFKKLPFNENFSKASNVVTWMSLAITSAIFGSLKWASVVGATDQLSLMASGIVVFSALPLMLFFKIRGNLLLGIVFLLSILFFEVPGIFYHQKLKVLGALFFIMTSAVVAYAAIRINYKKLFDAACLLVGLRIVIIYFEVFGTLLETGVGLILSGLFIILVSLLWHKKRNALWKVVERSI